MQKCMANWQPSPAQRRANCSAATAARASRTPCRDSVRTASGRIGTGRSLEEPRQTCVWSARCDALSRERRRLLRVTRIQRDATGTYPWWASPAGPAAASVAVSPLVSLPMPLERSAFTRATYPSYPATPVGLPSQCSNAFGRQSCSNGKPPVVRPVTLWIR